MKKNYVLWLGGIVLIIIIVALLSMQGPTAATTAPGGTTETTGTPATGGSGSKPTAVTSGFASVSTTTAVVVGTTNPDGAKTTYWFEYGTTMSYGSTTDAVVAAAGWKPLGAAAYITGLKPATQYYFRLGAKNAYGTAYGSVYSFITATK